MADLVRVFYEKADVAKYISHLDMQRAMQRALKKSGLPVWYTEGFNPHAYITFALPMGIGVESVRESFDIKMCEEVSFEEIAQRIGAGCPIGINVLYADKPMYKASAIKSAGYKLIYNDNKSAQDAFDVLSADSIPAKKKSKSGLVDIELKEYIREVRVEGNCVEFLLPVGNELSISATVAVNSVCEAKGDKCYPTKILRTEIFTSDMKIFK